MRESFELHVYMDVAFVEIKTSKHITKEESSRVESKTQWIHFLEIDVKCLKVLRGLGASKRTHEWTAATKKIEFKREQFKHSSFCR